MMGYTIHVIRQAHHRKEPAMTRINIASDVINLADDHQLYTIAFTDGCEAMDYETGTPVYYDNHMDFDVIHIYYI